ncbi:MAG: anthranilate synthase component I family protein [Phycisphaerales bacterium]|nr:anthranilate synthase component I family protein [Phycisphaerales bacterium]
MARVSSPQLLQKTLAAQRAADFVLQWPTEEPLAALVSGGAVDAQNAWTILARPRETIVVPAHCSRDEAISTLDAALARTPRTQVGAARDDEVPFTGGWIIALGYSLGECFEPSATCQTTLKSDAPRAVLHWCEDAWCFHHATGALHNVGNPPACTQAAIAQPWELRELRARETDAQYAQSVAKTLAYIHAGDIYQANIARRFDALCTGSMRSFAHAAICTNASWFGALFELPDGGAVVSMSPELFLRVATDGRVTTRPIKGTRPSEVAANELLNSAKDAAELAMIVDLMRSDLGRVADIGSVRVAQPRLLETHQTVHHSVAEIHAQLREDASWLDVLRATFPPGSVTGAPKVRAMQIIDELEVTPRSFYCGGIGFISRSGNAAFNVAIRTAQLSAPSAIDHTRTLTYHAGCGIVAESNPMEEVAETLAKVRALAQLVT